MADFLTYLVQRAQNRLPTAQPQWTPRFAPRPSAGGWDSVESVLQPAILAQGFERRGRPEGSEGRGQEGERTGQEERKTREQAGEKTAGRRQVEENREGSGDRVWRSPLFPASVDSSLPRAWVSPPEYPLERPQRPGVEFLSGAEEAGIAPISPNLVPPSNEPMRGDPVAPLPLRSPEPLPPISIHPPLDPVQPSEPLSLPLVPAAAAISVPSPGLFNSSPRAKPAISPALPSLQETPSEVIGAIAPMPPSPLPAPVPARTEVTEGDRPTPAAPLPPLPIQPLSVTPPSSALSADLLDGPKLSSPPPPPPVRSPQPLPPRATGQEILPLLRGTTGLPPREPLATPAPIPRPEPRTKLLNLDPTTATTPRLEIGAAPLLERSHPIIEVSIGRLEVRVKPGGRSAARPRPSAGSTGPKVSLNDYLQSRNGPPPGGMP